MKTKFIHRYENPVVAIPPQSIAVPYLFKLLVSIVVFIFAVTKMASAQCTTPPTLVFTNPKLISGTDNQIGAIYLFPDVMTGVDAHVEIMDIVGGAALMEIDNTTGAGYFDAFQPYVLAGANDTSYLDWKIVFKVAGSNTDTILECLAVTAIDVDGNNKNLKEFVEAATPGSFAVDPFTNLTISFDGIRSKAEGQIATIPLIDTAQRQAMFQMNFTNINSLLYRNGAITTGDTMTRQTCIYFKPFFSNWILLPVKLLAFSLQQQTNGTIINWSTIDEQDTKWYTVQISTDGKTWKNVSTLTSGGLQSNAYKTMDVEKNNTITYYRLKYTSKGEINSYSKVIMTGAATNPEKLITHNSIFKNAVALDVQSLISEEYIIELYSLSGSKIKQQRTMIHSGANRVNIETPGSLTNGVYILSIKNSNGKQLYTSRLIKD